MGLLVSGKWHTDWYDTSASGGEYVRQDSQFRHEKQAGVADTVDFDHIKTHYYYSHDTINPTRIVPLGPEIDYTTPHNRERF